MSGSPRLVLGVVSVAALVAWCAPASAQNTRHSSQVALSVERLAGFGLTHGSSDPAQGGVDLLGFNVAGAQPNPLGAPRIGLDFIMAGGFALGGAVGFSAQSLAFRADTSTDPAPTGGLSTLLLELRAGYRVRLGRVVELLPRGGFTVFRGSLSFPDTRSCYYTWDPMTGSSVSSCRTTEGPTGSVLGLMFSIDAVARFRLTPSFFLDTGFAYDHVLTANLALDEHRSSGVTLTTEPSTSGTYLNLQVWAGLGGYL